MRRGLGRLNPDGTLDPTFDPQIATGVVSMVAQADGKVLVGGLFTQMGGQPRERIARFNADGTLDLTFNPVANGLVNSLFVQSDGSILIGGEMTTVGGQPRVRIARLSTDRPATQSLMLDPMGRTITWLRGGASPEVDQVFFSLSTNGSDFTILGSASRISGGWRLTGVALPGGENIYLRAQGLSRGGRRNGSSGLIESVAQFWRLPSPFLSSVQVLSGGAFQFSFTNTTTTNFIVLVSTNVSLPVSSWTSLGPPMAVGNGVYQFSDPAATNHAQRFYQLRSP